MKQLTAVTQRRFYENALIICASRLIFSKLLELEFGVPLRSIKELAWNHLFARWRRNAKQIEFLITSLETFHGLLSLT